MSKITITDGQNIIDVAIQEYGSIESVFDILEDNQSLDNLDVILNAGDKISVFPERIVNKEIVNLTKLKQRRINTEGGVEAPTGIGAMIIGQTFIVA